MQKFLTTKLSNMDQSLNSCSSEGRKMDAGFKLPVASARTPQSASRQDRKPSPAVSTAPVDWSVCTALSCWACASASPNICCTSCWRRPTGFLFEQKAVLQCLQKYFCVCVWVCVCVCAAFQTDGQWQFMSEIIPCLLCETPGRKFGYT